MGGSITRYFLITKNRDGRPDTFHTTFCFGSKRLILTFCALLINYNLFAFIKAPDLIILAFETIIV